MSGGEPEDPLTRAGLVGVLGGAMIGLSQSGWVSDSMSETFLLGGGLLVLGSVVASLRVLLQHWKDRGK